MSETTDGVRQGQDRCGIPRRTVLRGLTAGAVTAGAGSVSSVPAFATPKAPATDWAAGVETVRRNTG